MSIQRVGKDAKPGLLYDVIQVTLETMNNRDFLFGFVEEQSAFEERNREFVLETELARLKRIPC